MVEPSTLVKMNGKTYSNPFRMGVCPGCGKHTEIDTRDGLCNLWGCIVTREVHGNA